MADGGLCMDEKTLLAVITKCGWKGAWEEQVKGLLSKLELLERTGRYGKLLANLKGANDKSNFTSSVLEVTIAFQFESAGIELQYEIRQDAEDESSIDFCWTTKSGKTVYIEVRLLQQDKATADSISSQLDARNMYAIAKDGDGERQDIVRVQKVVLDKVQKKDGSPTKFLTAHQDAVNLVAVDVSQIILGTFDVDDCKLVTLGDPSVPVVNRREVFGLFQETEPSYPEFIQSLAQSFDHIKKTLHGVLFLFRRPKKELFNFSVERFLSWSPMVDEGTARDTCTEIEAALPLLRKRGH
jgi:hypothetical protein